MQDHWCLHLVTAIESCCGQCDVCRMLGFAQIGGCGLNPVDTTGMSNPRDCYLMQKKTESPDTAESDRCGS